MTAEADLEFGSTGEAVGIMKSAARYLAAADYPGLPAQTLADVLAGMEQVDAVQAAIRGRAGQVFTGTQAHLEFAQKSLGVWYRNSTRVTPQAASAHKAWARRHPEHPLIMDALAEADVISESWARQVMAWTGNLPEEFIQQADQIMIQAARNDVDLPGLARIAAELGALLTAPSTDEGKEPGPGLRLDLTFDGAGVLHGDLSPACAAKVNAVLESLAAAKTGPEDTRTRWQRMHDALEEAMTRLLAARLVPQSQGAPTTAIAHIHFGDLVAMDPGSILLGKWETEIIARWKAEQAGVAVQPGDGGCWLTGDEARRIAADAMIVPVVTTTLDPAPLGDLITACLNYHHAAHAQDDGPESAPDLDDLLRKILGTVIAIASGTASYLRQNQLGRIGLGGPSLPLDVGDTSRIPPQIRRAVLIRDRGTCAAPGGCGTPAIGCDQHHTIHRANGGHTSLHLIGLFCQFHHDYLIHTLGWTITIEPDGTMTARKPDGTIYTRSHPPPPRPS